MARTYLTLGVLATTLLLSFTAFSSTYVILPDMVLLEKCEAMGVPAGQCDSSHPSFVQAQAEQASFMSMFTVVTNVPCLFLCALFAHLSDRVGRKPFLLMTGLQGALSSGLMLWRGVARSDVVAACTCLRLLGGSIFGTVGNCMAAAADVTVEWSSKDRARVFSGLEGAIWIGQLLGPVTGGVASNLLGPQRSLVFATVVFALSLLVVLVSLPETLPREQRLPFTWRKANPLGGVVVAWRFPVCLVLAAAFFFAQFSAGFGGSLWPLYCKKEFQWPDGTIGALMSVCFTANAVGLIIIMPILAAWASPKAILVTSVASGCVMWSLFATTATAWHFFAVACIGAGAAMMYPVIRNSLATMLGPQLYGAGLGLVALVEMINAMIGPALGNQAFRIFEVQGMPDSLAFAIAAAALLVALVVFACVPGKQLSFERGCQTERLCEVEEVCGA
mmetsp:Transcript_52537/g.163126  ORF Transcript_52537/g.163126 Transcript_52537/m.163126 type:complete len:447 (+) Transcript_52537:48-1388(+)